MEKWNNFFSETYYKMVVMCISEIAFGNMGNGPDFGKQVNLNLKLGKFLNNTFFNQARFR
jgi:hypothetical protein